MDKNKIKSMLNKRFLAEESTPGIKVTQAAQKKSGEINKDGVKAIEKDTTAYNKSLKQDKDTSKMAPNKFNYTDDFEKEYHEEMEIMNGQEMIQYDRIPNKEFKERAEEAIAGSSRMGNNPEWANVVAKGQGGDPEFGKNLVKKIKASMKKRGEETPAISLRGKDIQELPTKKVDNGHKPIAIEETQNNNNPKIKESMKRLKFNKDGKNPFNGMGNALKLIPEGYKVDKKEFEMTDGIETYRIRWEGNLNEGKAVVLTAADNKLINEDIQRMKVLFGYKSQDTLGLVKGKARIDENKAFADVWNKTRKLMTESEEIEGQDAEKEAPFEEADVNHAPEAKKHVQGSVPQTDLGGTAPKPKTGEWEKINVKQAAEAKKHVEGSVAEEKKTEAPAPKEGNWEEIKKKSSDATAHVESGKPTNMATDKAKVVKEGVEDEEGEEEVEDTFYKADDDDSSSDDAEPTAKDVAGDVPTDNASDEEDVLTPTTKVPTSKDLNLSKSTIMFSKSTGDYWLKSPSLEKGMIKVPAEFLEIASNQSIKASKRAEMILDKMDEMGSEEELDEYGDEHHISTADAVAGMKPGSVKEYGDEHPVSTADAVKKMNVGK